MSFSNDLIAQLSKRVIAIDGPAGSGKSTVSRLVADKLGIGYLDTGAMYRVVALAGWRKSHNLDDETIFVQVAQKSKIQVGEKVLLDSQDVSAQIRQHHIDQIVSKVAAMPKVRKQLLLLQYSWAKQNNGGVIEGRDIGSVVFPLASLKIYLTADSGVRAKRRSIQSAVDDLDSISNSIKSRDILDSSRTTAPLIVPKDAQIIDSSHQSIEQIVDYIIELSKKVGF